MKLEFGLVAKPSDIPGAGLGLFFVGYKDENGDEVNTIKPRQVVTRYSGKEVLTKKEYHDKYPEHVETSYGVCTRRGKCLDGGHTDNFPGRLINHKAPSRTNVKWGETITEMEGRYTLPIYATKNIRAGSELYINYGTEYWKGKPKS